MDKKILIIETITGIIFISFSIYSLGFWMSVRIILLIILVIIVIWNILRLLNE